MRPGAAAAFPTGGDWPPTHACLERWLTHVAKRDFPTAPSAMISVAVWSPAAGSPIASYPLGPRTATLPSMVPWDWLGEEGSLTKRATSGVHRSIVGSRGSFPGWRVTVTRVSLETTRVGTWRGIGPAMRTASLQFVVGLLACRPCPREPGAVVIDGTAHRRRGAMRRATARIGTDLRMARGAARYRRRSAPRRLARSG